MEKFEQTARVTAIRDYLSAIGTPISTVQAYEVLARALGRKSKHVLAAKATGPKPAVPQNRSAQGKGLVLDGKPVAVMARDADPLSVQQMQALDWSFDVVIPVPLERLESIEALNDYASEFITGNETALEGIAYEHVPEVQYGKGFVAQRVTAFVSSPEDLFKEVADEEDARFYQGLRGLAAKLTVGVAVERTHCQDTAHCTVSYVDTALLQLFSDYAVGRGSNNEAVNEKGQETAVVLRPVGQGGTEQEGITLDSLKYAKQVGPQEWQLSDEKRVYRLRF